LLEQIRGVCYDEVNELSHNVGDVSVCQFISFEQLLLYTNSLRRQSFINRTLFDFLYREDICYIVFVCLLLFTVFTSIVIVRH